MATYRVSRYHLLAFALISVLQNSVGRFEYSLRAGLGYQIIFNVVSAFAMVIYYCCASELTSTFPFPGGCFGFARCTIGFYPGFLVGCLELFYYVNSVAISAGGIFLLLADAMPRVQGFQLFVILGVLLLQFCLCMSRNWVYTVAFVLAAYGIVINLAFILGSWRFIDFDSWAYRVAVSDHRWNDDGITFIDGVVDDDNYYRNFPITEPAADRMAAFFNPNPVRVVQVICDCLSIYMQVEYANLAVDDSRDPKKDVPFALLVAVGIQIVFGTINPILASSMAPGVENISMLKWPIVPGFARVFNISQHQAVLLIIPIYFGHSMATFFALGKLIPSMADSNLLPKVLSRKLWRTRSPVYAMLAVLLFVMINLGAARLIGLRDMPAWTTISFMIVTMSGLITYCIQLVGFIELRVKLSRFPREFTSPFGVFWAIFAMLIFLLGIVSILMIRVERTAIMAATGVYIVIPTVYYFVYARHQQTFSDAEKAVMLPAHAEVKNANGEFDFSFVYIPKF
jgi:ethanolamine permease